MKHMRTEEEIREYNKRIEEVFRKHNLIPKRVDIEENSDYIVIFPGEKSNKSKTVVKGDAKTYTAKELHELISRRFREKNLEPPDLEYKTGSISIFPGKKK